MLDRSGRARPLELFATITLVPSPAIGCGWPLGAGSVAIPFDQPVPAGKWVMRIGYVGTSARSALIHGAGEDVRVELAAGTHQLYVVVDGPLQELSVIGVSGGAAVCITEVQAGQPRPAGD
jgi:hypothetical protein